MAETSQPDPGGHDPELDTTGVGLNPDIDFGELFERDQKGPEDVLPLAAEAAKRLEERAEKEKNYTRDLEGQVVRVLNAYREKDETARQLEQRVNIDDLTGLLNRRAFIDAYDQMLEERVESRRRNEQPGSNAVMFLDLDDFKALNDHNGHDAGDKALVDVADILRHRTRPTDSVGRFGGDEFMVLLRHVTEEEAAKIADEIHNAINERSLSASMGVRVIDPSIERPEFETSKNEADQAMYKAKEDGKNQVIFFGEQPS